MVFRGVFVVGYKGVDFWWLMMFLGVFLILFVLLDGCLICFFVFFVVVYRNFG